MLYINMKHFNFVYFNIIIGVIKTPILLKIIGDR